MDLGAFSVSLSVKDLEKSRAFYATLGFAEVGGDAGQGWLILRSGTTTIGLFSGMFDGNILTFNPGWNAEAEPMSDFTDVREIAAELRAAGVALSSEPGGEAGPASLTVQDPDGNVILIDQHV